MANSDLKISDLDEHAVMGAVPGGIKCGRLPEATIREDLPTILEKFNLLLPAPGFIGDIDQHLGIVAQGHIARKRCGLPFHKGSNGLGIDPELQTVALRGGFVAVQSEFRGFMAIEEVLQLAQPENVVARTVFR